MESIYIETSFFSYITARLSNNLIDAARQQVSFDWWEKYSKTFSLFVSDTVIAEAEQGDTIAAEKRLNFIKSNNIPILDIDDKSIVLAEKIFNEIHFPVNAKEDSVHIAVAITNKMDYLLSWNFRHIANVHFKKKIELFCDEHDYNMPILCSPEEFNPED